MKILVVTPRFGSDVVGAAEEYARTVAILLAQTHAVEVATTTAFNALRPAHFPSGTTDEEGMRIHRFGLLRDGGHGAEPSSPGLLSFLHGEGRRYDAILFYDHQAPSTVLGLPIVPERAALIPMAVGGVPDERPFRALFHMPRALGFVSPEERARINAELHVEHIPYELLITHADDATTSEFTKPLEDLVALTVA